MPFTKAHAPHSESSEASRLTPVWMAGLIADVRTKRLGPKDVAVFIHTGGTPAVFAYRDELMGSGGAA